jgi:hypothetical protein
MKRILSAAIISLLIAGQSLIAQSEAGAIFLLIAPGSRAEGMGEAQVAAANDAYATYWNPAGLGFLENNELGIMHVKWLPNLADDMYYDFLTGAYRIKGLGTVGGHVIYLNLGEQQRTDENGNELGTFVSYMTALTLSYGTQISPQAAFGVNAKIVYQMLSPYGTIQEKGRGDALSFGFDFGYLKRNLLFSRLDFGVNVSNIGPKVAFIDVAQADPMPTNLKMGFNLRAVESKHNQLSFVADANKLLVASYPAMDKNGNFIIDDNETAYTDPWYKALITSWFDDWRYVGDIDFSGDDIIGGYDEEGIRQGWYDDAGNETVGGTYDQSGIEVGWGEYGGREGSPQTFPKEVNSKNSGSFVSEIEKMVFNVGVEYVYGGIIALRAGYIYDKAGSINNPTLGFGLKYNRLGFDFGYTSGQEGHPLTNTMRISLRYLF